MRYYYDFHIHSCLSPCGDDDMTPNNIVNMSILKGLDIIALTDHNCAANIPAVLKCAKGRITVLCGMEIESCEEVHMICLFDEWNKCRKMWEIVHAEMNPIKNDAEIFGEQLIMNENDEISGKIDNLLVTATRMSVYDICRRVHEMGGVCIAAHVDKSSYSILSNLGFIPDDLNIDCIEISRRGDCDSLFSSNEYLKKYMALFSSDAHYLEDISERENFMEIDENVHLSAKSVVEFLKREKQ